VDFTAVFLILGLALPVSAASVWTLPAFTSDAAAVYDEAQKFQAPPRSDLYLIDLNVAIEVDGQGRAKSTRRSIFRVLDENGVKQLANLSEPWFAWRQDKPHIQVRVITPDKQAHMLDPATLTEANMPGVNDMYADVKLLQAPLPSIASNSVVEIEIQESDREPVFPGGRFGRYRVQFPYAVQHFALQIQAPANLQVEARSFADSKRTESSENGSTLIRFEAWNLKKFKGKPMLPPELPSGPEIEYTTARSWGSVAAWYEGATEPVIGIADPGMQAPPDPRKVEAVLAGVQEKVRYAALELGMGAYVPRTPQQTIERGYGDCKDKAVLLVRRLREAGIPARLALLTPYPSPDVDPAMPGLEAFDHVIVYVPGPQPLWIDPTSRYTPATRLPLADQNRSALIVDSASTALVKTPGSASQDNGGTQSITVKMRPSGKPDVEGSESYIGGAQDFVRDLFGRLSSVPDMKDRVEGQMKRTMGLTKLSKVESTPVGALDEPFVISYAGSGWQGGKTERQTAYAAATLGFGSLGPAMNFSKATYADEQEYGDDGDDDAKDDGKDEHVRKEDVYVLAAQSHQIRYRIIPPRGFVAKQVPELRTVELGVLKLEQSASVRPDNSVEVIYKLDLPRNRFTAVEAQAIAKAVQELRKNPTPNVQFVDEVLRMLTDGKDKEALSIARGRVQDAPQDALPMVRLASTLSALGVNTEAIKAGEKACRLDPKSAEAYATLAELYAKDEVGRPFRPGMQIDKAIEAQRQAVDLDSDDKLQTLKLSTFYEYNSKGERYAPDSQMAESVLLLRKIESDLPKLNAVNYLAAALLFNRQYAEVKAFYDKGAPRASLSYDVAAVAIADGIDAARQAFDKSSTKEVQSKVFRDAAHHALLLGEYSAAASLMRESEKEGGTESDETAVSMLAQTRRREAAKYSDNPAIAVVERLIYSLLDRKDEESWRKLLVPEWRDLEYRARRNEVWSLLSAYHQLGTQRLTLTAAADLAVSTAAFTVEGSDKSGYRVRFADPSGGGSMKTLAWVVKRGDDYQVAGLANDIALAGSEALKAAQSGDLETARQWLDWVREDQAPAKGLDPLAGIAFLKLWPVADAGKDDMLLAAASLAVRGKHYEAALDAVREIGKHADPNKRESIDRVVVEGLAMHRLFAEAVDPAHHLFQAFSSSDAAFTSYTSALTYSGDYTGAASVIDARLTKDPKDTVALRAKSNLLLEQRKYAEAVDTLRQVTRSAKATAADWNRVAWVSLYTDKPGADAIEAANNAVRLTQNKSASSIHTLGCVQAASGDTASARKQLNRYLDIVALDDIDEAGRVQFGLILEQLGFDELARRQYELVKKPENETALSSYELAQRRLTLMEKSAVTH
jgi:tetratricopeptide (TPR) repeat protein